MVAEYVGVTVLVDARQLARGFGLPGVQHFGEMARGLALVAAATLFYGGPGIVRALRTPAEPGARKGSPWRFLAAHVVSFGLLLGLTLLAAFGGRTAGLLGFVAWVALGLTTLYFLVRAAAPLEQLRAMKEPLARGLGAGTVAGVAAWGAGKLATYLWPLLSGWTLSLAAAQLEAFTSASAVSVDAENLLLGCEGFTVHVAPVCSGLEGVGLAIVLSGAYVLHSRSTLRFPNALLLVPLAAAVVWIANSTRIALLVLIGAYVSPAIAVSGFHSKAGWVFFCVIAIGIVWLSRALPFFAREPAQSTHRGENPTVAYLAPLIALLGTMMLTGLFALDSFDPFYVLRLFSVLGVVWLMRERYASGTFSPSPVGVVFGGVTFAVWMLLTPHAAPAPMPEALASLSPGVLKLWLTSRVLGAVIAVPVAEELAFRGFVLRRLQGHDFEPDAPPRFTLLSFLGSSLLFALMHQSEMLPALLVGMLFAVAYLWRGRLGDAIWAHALCNALVAAWVLAHGAWGLW